MDKGKSRTDLLAAGRKKLQQYRQKKDGKGSKSSGQANKPDPDVVSDESSSKATKGKKQLPPKEVPVQSSDTEHVDSSNADVVIPDLSSTLNLPIEVSEAGESVGPSVPDENLQSSNLDDSMRTVSSPRTVNIEETPDSGYVSVMSLGLEAGDDFARKEGEWKAASGEDQVPDEHEHSFSEADNTTSLIDPVGDVNPGSSTLDERAQVNSEDVEENSKMEYISSATKQTSDHDGFPGSFMLIERAQVDSGNVENDSKMEYTSTATEQTSEHDGFPDSSMPIERAQVSSGDAEEDSKMDTSSGTEQTSERDGFPAFISPSDEAGTNNADLHSSGPPSSDPEPTIQPKEDVMVGFHGNEGMKLPPTSGDSEDLSLPIDVISGGETIPVSLSQLAKALQLLGEDDFRFVMAARESVSGGDLKNDGQTKSGYVEFSEGLREHLYVNSLEKELISLQLYEERDVRKEFDQHHLQWFNEKSSYSASLGDVEGKNKILSEELATCRSELDRVIREMEKLQMDFSFSKTELDRSSARIAELQIELEQSENQLSTVSSELVDSRSLVSDLQEKNENLNVHVASLTEEKNKVEKDKEDAIQEEENLTKELMECKSLLELSQAENVNTKGSLALVMEERVKLEEDKENYVSEKGSLLTELVEWKRSVDALQAENAKLNEVIISEREDRSKLEEANEHIIQENNKFSAELSESQYLVETLHAQIAKLSKNLDLVTEERTRLGEEINNLSIEKEEVLIELTNCKYSMSDLQLEFEKSIIDLKDRAQRLEQLTEENVTLTNTLDVFKATIREFDDQRMKSEQKSFQETIVEDSTGFVVLKQRLSEVERVMHELEKAIAGMHSQSGVSELVRNFELKGQSDESEEIPPSAEDSKPPITVKNMDSLKDLFRGLVIDAEKASEIFKVESSGNTPSDCKLEGNNYLEEHSKILEETFFKHLILDEIVKQYVCTVEAKKGELVYLCEDLRQEGVVTKTKNSELTEKLCNSESRRGELQAQVDELRQQEDHMASLSNELETLHRKLDAAIGTISVTHSSETDVGQNISTRMATSVGTAVTVIHDLQEKLDDALRNHNLLSDSYKDLSEKTKDLKGMNELASHVIHKVFDNLQKIVNDSEPSTEEGEDDTTNEQLDHLELSNYDVFIEKMIMMLHERAQLESKNREYNLELLRKMKDMEEVNKRCVHPDVIAKLFEDIQSSITLDNIEIKPDEPVSSLESIIYFLVRNLKSNEMKSIELQNKIDDLTSSIIPYEIESQVFKGTLRSAMEQLVTLQSETHSKETELHQSEQRVSALREKLHIAVTKGKSLIQHRDSLKQNFTAASNELEKCLQELQLKDATLQETEAKLKSYSEAGERMEALESELSYIRNSATALRESFLLKDSVLQRIEEILEDLELPEDFHVRDIIEKIDWLAKSVSMNSFPVNSSNQANTIERTLSYPDSVSRAIDGWREDFGPSSGPGDDELKRNYEELQNNFYGLAEQNEMLEQSLVERNNLVQRWEEILDKINMPPQLQSLEPEDRIEWLRVALLEANDRCDSLQQDINDLQKVRGSLAADLEESQRRLGDLEAALKSITDEREQLSSSLEVQKYDYNKISGKAELYEIEKNKLQKEVGALRLELDEKSVDEEQIHHIHGEIRRLQDLVKEMLQDPETEVFDSSASDMQRLEGLLKKLADKYIKDHETSGLTHEERSVDLSDTHGELERKLEEAEGDLVQVKDERDRHVETNQSLLREIEALEVKNQELQKLLAQEEQKTATVKEKLNVAVRKGKSLVQVRDSMKQNIIDLTSQVERLTSEIKVRESTLLEYQQKMKDLITSQEVVENKDSEIQFLKNRLEEAGNELQVKRNTSSMILGALAEIDLGAELTTNDPFEKMKQIEKVMHDLQAATSSAEQDSRKSKRAAELLLAELNEIQDRNEDLLEELSKITMERDSAEAAKHESLSRLEQLSALHLEERSSQFSELLTIKSGLEQLKPGFSSIYNLLNDVLPKDLDYLYNLEANLKSLLDSSDTSNAGGQTRNSSHRGIGSRSESKVNVHSKFFVDGKREELHNDNKIIDLWRFVGSHMQDLVTNVGGFEEKLQSHSKCLHEEIILLSETVSALSRELNSHKHSLESAKEEIAWLESTGKQKETENSVLRKYTSVLYEACKSSVLEIEKSKGELVADDSSGEILNGETLSVSEERITSMVNRLLSFVKDFHSTQAESMEINLKEMKATIYNLQKELTEKDVQKDRICVDLVSQIKRAEAAAMSNLQELEPAKAQINELKGQLEAVNVHCNALEQRIKELEGQESILFELREKVKSLTNALTAKEQEAESLLQALDEEETQMEDLTNKITELERVVQQKDLDLESSEAARGKALKKLSITVSKFDELHHLSETLLSEVDKLQSQLQERDSEVSFLRDEITRCTSDSLQALETDKRGLDEIQDLLTWLDSMGSGVEMRDVFIDDNKIDRVHEYKETLKKQITSIISELKDLRQVAQSKDDLLHIERSKVDDLNRRREVLESSLREQESLVSLHENDGDTAERTSMTSEIVEVEPLINKWPQQGTLRASQVRSLRKVNNDQLAISIDDVDSDDKDKLEDDDDDKAHGFKSLTTSKLVPRFTRPVTDFVDGLWVSCDRTLMRQPALRLSLILYWALMHALLAAFVV